MKHLRKLVLNLIFLFLCLNSFSQESITTSGGNASGTNGSVNYSVGQVVYSSIDQPNGHMNHGVQQPFEIFLLSGTDEGPEISLECSVYPNPVSTQLKLSFISNINENYILYLYNLEGKELLNRNIESKETFISLEEFAPATYILRIFNNEKEVKSFKIIKN